MTFDFFFNTRYGITWLFLVCVRVCVCVCVCVLNLLSFPNVANVKTRFSYLLYCIVVMVCLISIYSSSFMCGACTIKREEIISQMYMGQFVIGMQVYQTDCLISLHTHLR